MLDLRHIHIDLRQREVSDLAAELRRDAAGRILTRERPPAYGVHRAK